MKKVLMIRDFREDDFVKKLEDAVNTNEVISIHYSSIGSIHIAIVIIKEVKNGRKATRPGVQTATNSNNKRGRGSKKEDASKS